MLAYVRQVAGDDGDTVLCVNTLSRFPQPIESDFAAMDQLRRSS